MNSQKAREILLACRLGTSDVEDPEVREALALAQEDPALREWFEEQLRLQNQIRESLRDIPVPDDLRNRILAAQSRTANPWRQRLKVLLPLAAAIGLLATGIIFLRAPDEGKTWANFQSRMTTIALRQYSMDILSDDEKTVRRHFATHGTPADFPLPEPLARVPVKGGKSTTWHNQPVSMLCFNWQDKETLYLFVVDESAMPQRQVSATPKVERYKSNLHTASWIQGGKVYFLAAPIPPEDLKRLIASGGTAALFWLAPDAFPLAPEKNYAKVKPASDAPVAQLDRASDYGSEG